MKPLSAAEIREKFLHFFSEKGHHIEPSASLIPHEDPTLLWINSGVATLKKYFDGTVKPDNPRITNCQKSIRTNDIENVGRTARHNTFFEMLGNFSIGDYFKTEAIHWAWEFLTDSQWIGFAPDRLSVTIHPDDDQAFQIWHQEVGIPEKRIIRLEENFWDIGEGPCGPNSEIFYDRGEAYGNDPNDPELYPGGENERYLEIWNLVFSQYNHNPDGSYTPLPNKNIDTGMGLERMALVTQRVETNFETDLFKPIILKTADMAGVTYGKQQEQDTALKVIADHIRTVIFAVGDGALPSNEGRGYVIRRLLRRAVRYGKVVGIDRPFLYQLTPVMGEIMGSFYPEVVDKTEFISKVIRNEEERFHETLNEGLSILSTMIATLKKEGQHTLSGNEAFKLYDTYGFPLDLTEDFATEQGIVVDREGFEVEMNKQRDRARSARKDTDSMNIQGGALAEFEEESHFHGYDQLSTESRIIALIEGDQLVDFVSSGTECQLILDQTPFYAESGGQVADQGRLRSGEAQFEVQDVQKAPHGQHVHIGRMKTGTLKIGDLVSASVQRSARNATIKNHTATHLLHRALKDVIGEHVNQAGSLVAPDRLRFDFSHFNPLSEAEIKQIEADVNQVIWENIKVETMIRSLQEAKAMGAMALFGEKYGETVRVVTVGEYSIELCGGCHVDRTAEIGLFTIIQETGIGAGTRRIEAVTGQAAYQHLSQKQSLLQRAAQHLKTSEEEVPARIQALQTQIKQLEKEQDSYRAKLGNIEASALINQAQDIEGVFLIAEKVSVTDMNQLRHMLDDLKQKIESGVVVLGTINNEKVNLVAGVTPDLVKQGFHAGHIVKEVASRCGGGGGGRPDMAQAGGNRPSQLPEALAFTPDLIKSVLHS